VSSTAVRRLLYLALLLAFLLRHDLWLWDDARIVFGLPVGLTYHIAFCFGVSVLMALIVRFAWPRGLEVASAGDPDASGPGRDPGS
jgi:hypothetical protein